MKSPYKLEPRHDLVPLDHEQFITARPEHVKDMIIKMHMHNDDDLIRADDVLGRIMTDKKTVEKRYEEPCKRANKAHKALTAERKAVLENYEWAENLLKDKMKMYNLERDRKALEEIPEVTITSMSPPELRSKLKHTTFIEKYKFEVTDPEKVPPEFMTPDLEAIARRVNAMGEMAKIDGVTVYRDDIVRVNT